MSTNATIIPFTRYTFDAVTGLDAPNLSGANPSQYLEVDVTISEKVTRSAELTTNPVEVGIDVVDHKRPKPIVLEMRGICVDTGAFVPFNGPPRVGANDFNTTTLGSALAKFNPRPRNPRLPEIDVVQQASSRAQDSYDALKDLFASRDPIKIITGREIYESMMITDLVVDRSDAGLALSFSCTIQEFRYATTSAVPFVLAPVAPQTKKKAVAVVQPDPIEPGPDLIQRVVDALTPGK